ncbi:hypothetical protein EJB05_31898, partial [Eragrostis curvula]
MRNAARVLPEPRFSAPDSGRSPWPAFLVLTVSGCVLGGAAAVGSADLSVLALLERAGAQGLKNEPDDGVRALCKYYIRNKGLFITFGSRALFANIPSGAAAGDPHYSRRRGFRRPCRQAVCPAATSSARVDGSDGRDCRRGLLRSGRSRRSARPRHGSSRNAPLEDSIPPVEHPVCSAVRSSSPDCPDEILLGIPHFHLDHLLLIR